jgi:hypothetical protein
MTAGRTAVTDWLFSQTGLSFGDKPGQFKGKTALFWPFIRLKID